MPVYQTANCLKKSKLFFPIKYSLISLLYLGILGCNEDNTDPDAINAPDIYEFSSRFQPTNSSVDFGHINELFIHIDELEALLTSNFIQEYGFMNSKTTVEIENIFNQIYTNGTQTEVSANLNTLDIYTQLPGESEITSYTFDKTAYFSELSTDVSLQNYIPYDSTNSENPNWPQSLIENAFAKLSELATDSSLETRTHYQSIDQKSLAITFLKSAIPIHHITNVLLSDEGLRADNNQAIENQAYTQLEHNWDLAFAFSGSLSDLNLLSTETLVSRDKNVWENLGGAIKNKPNFLIQQAIAIDAMTPYAGSNLTRAIHQEFLNGRAVIQDLNNTTNSQNSEALFNKLEQVRDKLFYNIERALVAIIIANLNSAAILARADIDAESYKTVWSNLYAQYKALSLFNKIKMDAGTFKQLGLLINIKPNTNPATIEDWIDDLLENRKTLRDEYSFSQGNLEGWLAGVN